MIQRKELLQRKYADKKCTYFEYEFEIEEGLMQTIRFYRQTDIAWDVEMLIDRAEERDSQVYSHRYSMPKTNMPLEIIAATGIRVLINSFKDEIYKKSNIIFALGEEIEGM